jgi:starch phosphorylase
MSVRAYLDLGGLTPTDVVVQAVTGRVDANEQLHDITTMDMDFEPAEHAAAADNDSYRYAAELPLTRSGAVGYTVRVLPRNDLLASPAEMGLVTTA